MSDSRDERPSAAIGVCTEGIIQTFEGLALPISGGVVCVITGDEAVGAVFFEPEFGEEAFFTRLEAWIAERRGDLAAVARGKLN